MLCKIHPTLCQPFQLFIFQSIEEGSPGDSEIVQDYKKMNRDLHSAYSKEGKGGKKAKVRRHTTNKRPRELLFMRSINGEEAKTEDKVRAGSIQQ